MATRPKVFINGISGLLGYALALHLRKDYLVVGSCFRNHVHIPEVQVYPMTLKSVDVLEALVRVQRPDYIIGAAGMNDRKEVEDQPKVSDLVNIVLPVSMAILAGRLKSKYIFLNCAEVFDGATGNYSEEDTDFTLTDSVGKQKIAAHSFIRAQTLESTTLRIGRVLGLGHPYRQSFFDRIRTCAAHKKNYEASKKKMRSYVSTHSFALAVEKLLANEFPQRHRIFHVGGANISEFEMVRSWYELMGSDPKLVTELVDPPRDLTMTSKLMAAMGWKQETKRDLLTNLVTDLNPAVGIKKWQKALNSIEA